MSAYLGTVTPADALAELDALRRELAELSARGADLAARMRAHRALPDSAPLLRWEAACDQLLAERQEWRKDTARAAARFRELQARIRAAAAGACVAIGDHLTASMLVEMEP